MRMIEITSEKKHKMSELVEESLKNLGKLMNCIEHLESHKEDYEDDDGEEFSMKHGRYGSMSKHRRYKDDDDDKDYHEYRRRY